VPRGVSGSLLLVIGAVLIILGGLAANLFYAGRSSGNTGGDPLYAADVRVAYRTSIERLYTALQTLDSGFLRMEIRGSTVSIGTTTGVLGFAAAALGLRRQLDASRFEAAREWIEQPTSLVRRPSEGVVFRGRNGRGQYQDFTLVPRDGDVDRLLAALARAGAQVGEPRGFSDSAAS
jgi:hypothetical protein